VNDTIAINVSDTGCGIPGADIGRVFDPYFTTKQSGTGLGLAIVHKIVEAHGGQVKIASTEEKGTTVSLILPAKEEE
jgi:two-component system sensor histidine kinase HydH